MKNKVILLTAALTSVLSMSALAENPFAPPTNAQTVVVPPPVVPKEDPAPPDSKMYLYLTYAGKIDDSTMYKYDEGAIQPFSCNMLGSSSLMSKMTDKNIPAPTVRSVGSNSKKEGFACYVYVKKGSFVHNNCYELLARRLRNDTEFCKGSGSQRKGHK